MKLISIIVPVYKVEDYLERCIISILNQTYSNFELILVDDGSPDNCGRICDYYARIDKRIHVIHTDNGGLSAARNIGLKMAKGEYVAFVDSDDWVHKDYLKIMYESLINNDADICECNIFKTNVNLYDNNENISIKLYNVTEAMAELINDGIFHQYVWNKLYKRNVIDQNLFPIGKTNEDEFWTYKVFGNSNKLIKVSNRLYYYFQRNDSIMNEKYNLKRLDALEAKLYRQKYIKKYFSDLNLLAKINLYNSCVYAAQMSLKYLEEKDFLKAKQYINEIVKNIKFKKNDFIKIPIKQKLYIMLGSVNFWGICKLKNILNRGF